MALASSRPNHSFRDTGQQPGDVAQNRGVTVGVPALGHAPEHRSSRRRTGRNRGAQGGTSGFTQLPGFPWLLTTGGLQILFRLRFDLLAKQLRGRPVRNEDGVPNDSEGAYGYQVKTY